MMQSPHQAVARQRNEGPLTAVLDWRSALASLGRGLGRLLGIGAVHPSPDPQISSSGLIWPQWLAINTGIAVFIVAAAANASRTGQTWAVPVFYAATALLFLPIVMRLALADVSRSERVANVMIAGLGLLMLRVIRAPINFTGYDEYLHWVGAQQLAETGRLFTPNVLFPIAPFYPGLEIVTTALSSVSGLSIFGSALIVIVVARTLCIGALFLLYERIAGSARIAALGCIFYMGSSTFVFSDTGFSYASLAVTLLTFALLLDSRVGETAEHWPARMLMFFIAACALAMTHHLTAFALSGFLYGFLIVETVRRRRKDAAYFRLVATTGCAILVPLLWSRAMGDPEADYLGNVLVDGVNQAIGFVTHFGGAHRKLFTSGDGAVAPLWQRLTTLGSVALICIGLALGFFRSLSWSGLFVKRENALRGGKALFQWNNSRLILLTLITFLYPLSILFRMTPSGWEIGNRIGPFAFLGIGPVLAICVTSLLQGKSKSLWRASAIGAAATIILIGGIISSEGPRVLVPQDYQVSADEASIEPMGINTALWTKEWLGDGNRFGADRINRILLAGYGGQLVSSTLQHRLDAGIALVDPSLGDEELSVLSEIGIEYLVADLRLTTGRAVIGSYFDGGPADDMLQQHGPPEPDALLKFNSIRGVNRIFDNGYEIIFDVQALNRGQQFFTKTPAVAHRRAISRTTPSLVERWQSVVRSAGAMLLVFILPGFLLLRISEPRQKTGFETAIVALGMSVASVVALGLALHPLGALTPIGWILALFSLGLAGWLHLRRRANIQGAPALPGPSPAFVANREALMNGGQFVRLACAALLVIASIVLAQQGALNHRQFNYTELWLLPRDGQSHQNVTIGIKNEEKRQMTYLLELTLNGAVIERSANLVLGPSEERIVQRAVPVDAAKSEQRVEARLYTGDGHGHPVLYRRTFLSDPEPNTPE